MQNYNSLAYQPQFRPQMTFYKALPVTSEAEMNTYTVDFNGMPTYFHNQATNEIYVKQFDIKTGLTTTQKYIKFEADSKLINESKNEKGINTYKEDFNALNERLNRIENLLLSMPLILNRLPLLVLLCVDKKSINVELLE